LNFLAPPCADSAVGANASTNSEKPKRKGVLTHVFQVALETERSGITPNYNSRSGQSRDESEQDDCDSRPRKFVDLIHDNPPFPLKLDSAPASASQQAEQKNDDENCDDNPDQVAERETTEHSEQDQDDEDDKKKIQFHSFLRLAFPRRPIAS
jgi:hypothetical protein